jgi:hypothetical protein
MSSIKNCFNELEDKEFDGKKFLLHSRLRTDWIGESISVEYEVFFPPIECISSFEDFQQFVDKIEFETNYKKVNKIYELDDFEPEFQKINLYDIGEYEDIFRNLKIQIGNSTENNIEEIIYLHTLGTYMYHYNTNTGFSCEFIKTNEENILNPTKNEK